MARTSKAMEGTKRLMGALARMKPKPHEEMKVGKPTGKKKRKATRKAAKS